MNTKVLMLPCAAYMEPYVTTFESNKTAADYPGRKAVGMIRRGDDYCWVIDWHPPRGLAVIVR